MTFDTTSQNLYGTTFFGGNAGCKPAGDAGCGVVFRFTPSTGAYTVLYRFTGGADGGNPLGPLLIEPGTTLFGTANFGGTAAQDGTFFSLVPAA